MTRKFIFALLFYIAIFSAYSSAFECPGKIYCEAYGNMLIVAHLNSVHNCCGVIYFEVFIVEDFVIELIERQDGPPCDCICIRDMLTVLTGLEPGTYQVMVKDGEANYEDPVLCKEFWIEIEDGVEMEFGQPINWTSECGGHSSGLED